MEESRGGGDGGGRGMELRCTASHDIDGITRRDQAVWKPLKVSMHLEARNKGFTGMQSVHDRR